jgi:hypothetical protein
MESNIGLAESPTDGSAGSGGEGDGDDTEKRKVRYNSPLDFLLKEC